MRPVRLGLFDPEEDQPKFEPDLVGSVKYQALSQDASLQAMTLLSNRHAAAPAAADAMGVLPLRTGKRIAVIGPASNTRTLMVGGTGAVLDSAEIVCKNATDSDDWFCVQSPFEAIAAINGNASTTLSIGASIHPEKEANASSLAQMMAEAIAAAEAADAVVFVIGDDWGTEHEGMDRTTIELPGNQAELVSNVAAAVRGGVPLVSTSTALGALCLSTMV